MVCIRSAAGFCGAIVRSIYPLMLFALTPAVLPEMMILPLIVSTEKSVFSGI